MTLRRRSPPPPPWISTMIASLICICMMANLMAPVVARQPPIYWNSSNPLFHASSSSDSDGLLIQADPMDALEWRCPYYPSGEEESAEPLAQREYSIIWRVRADAFRACALPKDAEQVGRCDHPERPVVIKATLRGFSPLPGALLYQPGRTYHFIATASGSLDGIAQRVGGLCEKGLKMTLKVSSGKQQQQQQQHHGSRLHGVRGDRHQPATTVPTSSSSSEDTIRSDDSHRHHHHKQPQSSTLPPFWEKFLQTLDATATSVSPPRSQPQNRWALPAGGRRRPPSVDDADLDGVPPPPPPPISTGVSNPIAIDIEQSSRDSNDYDTAAVRDAYQSTGGASAQQSDFKLFEIHEVDQMSDLFGSAGSGSSVFGATHTLAIITFALWCLIAIR